MALARIAMAAGAGLFTPTAAALGVALVPPEARGRALSVTFSGVGLSYVIGLPFAAWAGTSRWGWPLGFQAVAATGALALLLLVRAPRGVHTAPASLGGFGQVLRDRRAMPALSVTAAYFAAIVAIFGYVGAFLHDYAGVPTGAVAPVLTGFGVAALAGTFAGGVLADRLGATRMLYAICAGFLAVFAVLVSLPGRTVPLVATFLAWGVIGFAFYAAQQSRLIAIAPRHATVMLALNASMLYVGAAAGAAIGGAVIASPWGYRGLPVVAAALIVAVAMLVRSSEPPRG